MLMKGYNDGGEIYLPTTTNNDSFSGSRKLRPLIPRPPHAPPHHVPSPTTDPPNNHPHHHGRGVPSTDHFLALNHHLATMADQSKREFNMAQQVVASSRWNPTPEQLRTLEDLWGRGTRTPSADEIQQITSRLRRYGKIEGKNVFYWFQNHKARERQKRRRQMESGGCPDEEHDGLNEHCETRSLGHKEAGGSSNTAWEDVRRSNNDTPIHDNNWGPAIEKEGKLAGGRGGGAASAPASLSAAASASSSSVVTSLWMKNLNDNNSSSARELLLNSPNTTIFSISGSCCCDDNDDNINVDVPVEWRNAAWHQLIATPPGSFSSSSCRPLLMTPLPTSDGHLIMTVTPETTASCSPSPASSCLLPSQEFQTLQLFPLRSCCDGEEDYLKGLGGRSDHRDNTGTGINEFDSNGHLGHHQFYEFLPLKTD